MAYAQINIKELSPRNDGVPIPTSTVFSFRLKPYNSELIDLTTLVISIKINGLQGVRSLSFTDSSDEITSTAIGDSFKIEIDVDPDGATNFEPNDSVSLSVEVDNTAADSIRKYTVGYDVINASQLDSIRL